MSAAAGGVVVEGARLEDLPAIEPAWRELAGRAEPNPFGDFDFVVPALRWLAPRRRPFALLVWSDAAKTTLLGALVLSASPPPFGLAKIWRHELAALPAVLVASDRAAAIIAGLLGWLRAHTLASGLAITEVEQSGSLFRALKDYATQSGAALVLERAYQRAALEIASGADFEASLDPKRRKKWGRQRRALARAGPLAFAAGADAASIEAFLALETAGWKGARGTALAATAKTASFAREMLLRFAPRGCLRIDRLNLAGAPIAAGVILVAGQRGFYWKTAYDERQAAFSPGVQLALDQSRALQAEGALELVDSCAGPDHPMIGRLWSGRLEFVDCVIAIPRRPRAAFRAAVAARRLYRGARERAKSLLRRSE